MVYFLGFNRLNKIFYYIVIKYLGLYLNYFNIKLVKMLTFSMCINKLRLTITGYCTKFQKIHFLV